MIVLFWNLNRQIDLNEIRHWGRPPGILGWGQRVPKMGYSGALEPQPCFWHKFCHSKVTEQTKLSGDESLFWHLIWKDRSHLIILTKICIYMTTGPWRANVWPSQHTLVIFAQRKENPLFYTFIYTKRLLRNLGINFALNFVWKDIGGKISITASANC